LSCIDIRKLKYCFGETIIEDGEMPKISRTLLSIVMIVVIFSSMLGVTGYSYWNLYRRHNELKLDLRSI